VGKFEQANGGTLFLDEIGDMSRDAQAKVLRVLEQGVLTRIGGSEAVEVDVRVLSATNKNLEQEIEDGGFRKDLFYRLNVVPIRVPSLCERQEDIPMLVTHFSEGMVARGGSAPRVFSDAAMERLKTLTWPGNVRELRNTVERLLILCDGSEITSDDVDSLTISRARSIDPGRELLALDNFSAFKEEAERAYIVGKLRVNDWNVAETARRIEMPRSNLYKKIEKYGLVRED
jgi:two-component system nitrogen regulation response regulator NtrX